MFLYNKSIFLQMGPQPKLPCIGMHALTRAWHTCITINPAIHPWLYALLGIENTSFSLYLIQ